MARCFCTQKKRAGAKDDGRSWLLIKHKDEWAGDVDITEFAPNSVKSAGSFREILAQDAPDVWLSNRGHTGETTLETLTDVLKKLDKIEPVPRAAPAKATAAAAKTSSAAKKAGTTNKPASTKKAAASARKARKNRAP